MGKILIAIIFISAIMDILPISKSIFEVNFLNRYIGKIKKGLVSLCLTGALLVSSVAVAALPEIIGLKELQPGMWGTGYTVIDASGEIRPFDVQVVGILGDNSKMSAKRILVNLYGPLIEETGGAISGMSGSPIYFNGRLAGALSAGYKDMYPTQRIMLTPIEDMLKIWDYPDTRNKTRMPQLDLAQMKAEREKFQADQEAVGLILQSVTFAKDGEIFVLDMGEPVKIYDLAKTLIKLSGKNVPIEIVGLRKGEKLYEELLMSEEGLIKTLHQKIMISKIKGPNESEMKEILEKLNNLIKKENCTRDEVKNVIKEVVPTFIDLEEKN